MKYDWSDLAFKSKRPINELKATFIAAPRQISAARFTQLVKEHLPKGNIVLGLAKERYVHGLENQPQFRMLQGKTVQGIIDKVNSSNTKHKIYALHYFQRELTYILEKLNFQKMLLVNGSWKQTFHTSSAYYALINRRIDYQLVSPFTGEAEARDYEARAMAEISVLAPFKPGRYSEQQMANLARQAATYSFDYNFQTGAVLGKPAGKGYTLLTWGYNKVVPYQTYAMHHGASREINFSPPYDLNHYDTVHAEVELLINAGKEKVDLSGTTLFINLMPCPTCSRMLAETDIAELVYGQDHSGGYAVTMLEAAGKKVRRGVA